MGLSGLSVREDAVGNIFGRWYVCLCYGFCPHIVVKYFTIENTTYNISEN